MLCIRALLATALVAVAVRADVYDLFFEKYSMPAVCKNGCADWATAGNASYQPFINALFIDGSVPQNAANHCSMPGGSAGRHECDCSDKNETITDSFAGPWCYCKDPAPGEPFAGYCTAPELVPEQINLQLAEGNVVVASFVTYEKTAPTAPAIAMFGSDPDNMQTVTGITHTYVLPDTGRTYFLHFVKLSGMSPRAKYYYKVRSGNPNCEWSQVYNFRAPYSSGETRVAFYGDMGHSQHNNMGNMLEDTATGAIDAIVHMGDHAYNLGMANGTRGDAYLNAFQPVISSIPWLPVIGNHEASDGDHYNRYLNQTWGETLGAAADRINPPLSSTATTPLGHILSKGMLYGASVHGSVPSNTSRYFGTDLGLLHIVGLDLNNLDDGQLAWLDADLKHAAGNRDAVPWIIVNSHFPIYHPSLNGENLTASAHRFTDDESEEFATSGHEYHPCTEANCRTVGEWREAMSNALEPVLLKYKVDIYIAGHVHDSATTWPMANGKRCGAASFDHPKCPIHITEGNGGVPGVPGQNTMGSCASSGAWCRTHGTGGAYARMTAFNATHLRYDHVQNPDGKITDSFVIVKDQ